MVTPDGPLGPMTKGLWISWSRSYNAMIYKNLVGPEGLFGPRPSPLRGRRKRRSSSLRSAVEPGLFEVEGSRCAS